MTDDRAEDDLATAEHNGVDGLFLTDAAIIRKYKLPEKVAYRNFKALDENKNSGFPPKIELWGFRRFEPAVRRWFERRYGNMNAPRERSERHGQG